MTDESWRQRLQKPEDKKFMPDWQFAVELFLERHWRGLLFCLYLVWCFYGALTAEPDPMPEWYYRCDYEEDC